MKSRFRNDQYCSSGLCGSVLRHDLNIRLAVGKLLTSSPIRDYAQGGSLLGWVPVLGEVLRLDSDTAVPASGPPVTKTELQAFKDKLE
jgi:hypothetical protein